MKAYYQFKLGSLFSCFHLPQNRFYDSSSVQKSWIGKVRRFAVLAGELGRGKKVCSSMSSVQFYNRTTRQYLLPILRRIDVGDHMVKIGRIVRLRRQHVKYYVAKLQKAGLVHHVRRSNKVDYELTGRGKNLLTSCEGTVFWRAVSFG
jgi:predicted transcriptional regulator